MTERANQAIDRLAAALHELAYQGRISITPDVRMLLCPGQPKPEDARHLHAIGLSAEVVDLLANAVERLLSDREFYTTAYQAAQHTHMVNAVDDAFADIDLTALTKAVLNDTTPENRCTVTRALDDLFGDIPTEDDTEAEG